MLNNELVKRNIHDVLDLPRLAG